VDGLLALALFLSFILPSTLCDSPTFSFVGTMVGLRRSARLMIRTPFIGSEVDVPPPPFEFDSSSAATRRRVRSSRSAETNVDRELEIAKQGGDSNDSTEGRKCSIDQADRTSEALGCLGRPRERSLLVSDPDLQYVMGIDEAGRGPLAGPVVAAAAVVPTNLPGVVDSKKITDEAKREELYESIVASTNVRWAVAIVDASTIDEINILQATLLGMRMAAQAVLSFNDAESLRDEAAPCISIPGCYVVRGRTDDLGQPCSSQSIRDHATSDQAYALVDGNRVPTAMPCRAEAIVKGDSKEYSIAAASILAKVTRDRLMHSYSDLYPEYNLSQHKGYPTTSHVSAIRRHGPCPIHRRTFAPIKHMNLVGEPMKSDVAASCSSRSTDGNSGTSGRSGNRRSRSTGDEGSNRPVRGKRRKTRSEEGGNGAA
jgi:ribonuclease HII